MGIGFRVQALGFGVKGLRNRIELTILGNAFKYIIYTYIPIVVLATILLQQPRATQLSKQ